MRTHQTNNGLKYHPEQMGKEIQPSQLCYDLLKHYEGLELEAYQCSAGKWTIGYGQTYYPDGRAVKKGDTITKEQAEDGLKETIRTFAISVIQALKTPVKQHQYDALVCLCYNIGIGAFESSTLLREINRVAGKDAIKYQWLRWNKVNKKEVRGLTLRRQSEYHLFDTGTIKIFN